MQRRSGDATAAWKKNGYVQFPGFLDEAQTERYAAVCERVVAAWRRLEAPGKTTNMAYLTEPRYFRDHREDLVDLLELIAHPRILDPLRLCLGEEPMFHNTQFFFEQPAESWDGEWHRDTQFDAKDDIDESARMESHTGVHFRIAFEQDPWLEIVPGSHDRWDTDEELAIRKSGKAAPLASTEMPMAKPIHLERGDAALFHAWSIHRGRYRTEPPRRTLDIIYGAGPCPFATPAPTCFANGSILRELSPRARSFFEGFVDAYRDRWKSSTDPR